MCWPCLLAFPLLKYRIGLNGVHDAGNEFDTSGGIELDIGTEGKFFAEVNKNYMERMVAMEENKLSNQFEPVFPYDPVCGKKPGIEPFRYSLGWKGQTYGFCTHECRETFTKSPELFTWYRSESGRRIFVK